MGSLGVCEVKLIFFLLTGWINSIFLECKLIPPSLLLLLAPYFKSPFIGEPIELS